uniref:Small ribosomal subunit protein mS39 n=1 Tax=Timema douglasi TaxID=61478 RepID=A0A7R8VQB7_TIMDO|nr:unnamed protein product [Timema douglasi]
MKSLRKISMGWRSSSSSHLKMLKNTVSNQSTTKEDIIIPKRIHRGPTDILRALASTVGRDYTAPHYKYHDDPYLIPSSNIGKRTFALSKESGRKAAQWIRQEHSKLFQHRHADPPIEAFYPRPVYDENSEVTEDTLKKVIGDVSVSDAITVYQLLEKKGEVVSESTKQSFLELLCYYNGDDALPEDLIEERWFRQGTRARERQRKTWKDNGVAETVFRSIEPSTSAAYCALLQGMTRHYQVDRAWQLFEEMNHKGIPLTTEAYNSLIRVTSYLREGMEQRWRLVEELLVAMAKQGLQPNVGTLNSALENVSTMGLQRQAKTYALRTLAEFRKIGVEPSLASYYFLLNTFCKERGPTSSILVDIMSHIKGRSFTIQDPKDTFFFVTAMDLCRNHLHDKDLAWSVDALLHTGNNYDLIGDSYKESIYYRNLFALLCSTEPFEVFMEFYNKMVPNIYIPEPGIMEEVLRAVDLNGAMDQFPRLWSDMVIFDHTDRENLVTDILAGMVRNQPPSEDLTAKFAKVAWDIWTKLEAQDQERYRQLRCTGPILGDVMILCLRAGDFPKASMVLRKLDKEQQKVLGVPKLAALQLFLETCIANKDVTNAIWCMQYCTDAGFPEAGQLAQLLKDGVELTDSQITELANIVGSEVMLEKETASIAAL